jgi:hypothetical protein
MWIKTFVCLNHTELNELPLYPTLNWKHQELLVYGLRFIK